MRSNYLKATLNTAVLAISLLLLTVGVSLAQQQVNLTAGPANLILPDGSVVPMWGYSCGGAVTGGSLATCAPLNQGSFALGGWSPVVITVPTGQDLQINLTNNLSFAKPIPTSLVIVGQLGGGLGDVAQRTTTPSPLHDAQQATWPIANTGALNNPPPQGSRVQSFSTEVAAGATTALTWTAPRPGTYLIESGTHPSIQGPMGLYGILVVTSAPSGGTAGTAYPGVSYNAEVPLLLSEIDPAQNKAVDAAVNTAGFSESATLGPNSARPITTISVTNGGAGYTSAPSVTFGSGAATAMAKIDNDPTSATYQQVTEIDILNGGSYTSAPNVIIAGGATAQAALQPATSTQCSGGAAACYPPVVNYTPLYYLINGAAFDKTNPSISLFQASIGTATAPVKGSVLVRFVNAGLRMHVPSIVGSTTGTAGGFSLIAEDGNPLPGLPRVQSEVFMAAGKTYDVMINVPAASATALPVFDRELSLSGNATNRDAGMLAYIGVNGAALPVASGTGVFATAVARADTYNALVAGQTLTVSDPSKGVIANDTNVYGAKLLTQASNGTVTLYPNGSFTYVPNTGSTATSDSFTYCANGTVTGATCSSGITATVTLGAAGVEAASGITCTPPSYTANTATYLAVKTPGVLAGCTDAAGYQLSVITSSITPTGLTVNADVNGGFTATGSGIGMFTFLVKNSQGTQIASPVTATVNFPAANGPTVTVLDGRDKTTQITDYRWIIEEDRTFYVDPACTKNPLPTGCPTVTPAGAPFNFGTNFHTSYMPVVASGCTGTVSCETGQTLLGQSAVCDVGNGVCRTTATQQTAVDPSQVHLDPTKRYYISVLPGDAAQPFIAGYAGAPDCSPAGVAAGSCGHGMGGAPIGKGQTSVIVLTEPTPNPPAKLTVFVFEDDWPLNGEHNAGGGLDVLAPQEPGLGGFQITLQDFAGGTGDATGTPTYDMFNMPLTNSLAGTIDPVTHQDACPISTQVTANTMTGDGTQKGIVGMIVTCPKYESDGTTLSPLAGQAVINNLYQGRYGVVAVPGADRIARGEEWLQTNTLDGQKAHDSFLRIGEPGYFQEFGPGGFHVSIGFANPKIINSRLAGLCSTQNPCTNEVKGHVTTARMSRPPDERLYGSGSRDGFAFTQCYASLGDPDGAEFAFVKCDDQGNFDFKNIPAGNWKLTLFDQWNDQIVDGIMSAVGLTSQNSPLDLGEIATHQWQANIYTRTFLDTNGDGVSNVDAQGNPTEPGLALVATNIRFRDGSYSNFNNTDLNGYAGFNEVFPLFNWYVVETDTTRYKSTGTHVVVDAGGPADGNGGGSSMIASNLANTVEQFSLPTSLRVPGARYCASADCPAGDNAGGSTGRVDPPTWFGSYGWQGYTGQSSFLEFGKKRFADGENGGIHGHVVYASTRPFDDPQLLLQLSWEPLVPHVQINLYKEGVAADGVTPILTLVDHTQTSSFDDWAQGFRTDASGNILKDQNGNGIPNMNCPGQATTTDPFWFGLQDQPSYLDWYNSQHGGPAATSLPNNSQFKCYDGMHTWNQLQPAPYDGMYSFPSVTSINPTTGKPAGTNCTACVPNPDASDSFRVGTPMLPDGKYVVEVVVPPGYELVKEEDKNILIGDNYIAPVTQQFAGLGNVFILPDQAEITNANNPQNSTVSLGRASNLPSHEGDTGSDESFWPCVGEARVVPDYISLFPGSAEVAPFAGAKRNLCDRKEVALTDQTSVLTKFYIFTSTHVASHYTGVITDDFTAEFDPFSPQFGEKFAPAYLPVSIKDWAGNEVSRTYSDAFGAYTGLNYSTWEVNPPNPTGYGPTMMVTCMNDAGTANNPDPFYQPGYSQFCYELPFMPGQTGYFDTPVVPTSSFSEGYNHPDCNYPDATPAIASVVGDVNGPWVQTAGNTLTITALGDQLVDWYGYSGPQVSTGPFNKQKVTRHYGFGTSQGNGTVTIGGQPATVTGWSDTSITVHVPSNVPACAVQQQAQYGGSNAQCGQLVITAANGKQSVDTVTVTIGGKQPTVLTAGTTIQSAIDVASPGDLIIVPPGVYNEMVIMWKPVRLQGVGAATSIINASPHPAGKLDPWRKQVGCLFGLTPDGQANLTDTSCSAGWNYASGGIDYPTMVADRIPMEGILGWDTTVNGNLAEQLIEPSLMGAYEGAAITVVGKGVNIPTGQGVAAYGSGAESTYPTGTVLLTAQDCATGTGGSNLYPSNFYCNPSSIDGLSLTNSSQGGGGIFVHGWAHNIQIANNRVHNNTGSMSGGITIGQGEHVDLPLQGVAVLIPPASCETGTVTNQGLPFCYNVNVNVHNNAVTLNSSIGDELFSSTPAGAGGVTVCNGADYYKFNYNWVCGNMSTGDGGGVAHVGWSKNGDIEHNSILYNQSTNPTITANGGGLLVMGAPDPDPPCGATTDKDCAPAPNTVGPSDGTGPGLVINANLIMGNSADSGSGGGLRLQHVNGSDVVNFPTRPKQWNDVTVTNNIIANNVAGWDGGGVSLQDALAVDIINNTIISNDSTASAGPLFGSLFAPLASTPPTNCTANNGSQSCPQVAGLVSVTNSDILVANLPATITCPAGHFDPNGPQNNGSCRQVSYPYLANDLLWQNRSFFIGVGNFGTGNQNQQKVVTLYNSFTTTRAPSQTATGGCPSASYWDIGVRGDTGPTNHGGGATLLPRQSIITSITGYNTNGNSSANPAPVNQYCNGSRVPPELGSMGYTVNPGTNETNALPNPVFSLTPSATVDEGNNWINLRWGPLALTHPVTNAVLGNYALSGSSAAIDSIPTTAGTYAKAPPTDFFGNPRPDVSGTAIDVGAVEFQRPATPQAQLIPASLAFANQVVGTQSAAQTVTLTNIGTANLNVTTSTLTGPYNLGGAGSCAAVPFTLGAGASCTYRVRFAPTALGPQAGTLSVASNDPASPAVVTMSGVGTGLASIAPNTGVRGTAVPVTITGVGLTGATAVTVSGGGVTVSAFSAVNDTTVTATFTITTGAATGARNVTVTTPAGVTNAVTFTVQGPTLTSISPVNGNRGTTVPVTLTGTNLTGATAVAIAGGGVTCTGITSTATTVNANCAITAGAGLGARNVTVTTPIGTTPALTNGFTVTGATVAFSGPNPSLVTGTTTTHSGFVTVTNTATGANAGPFTFTAAPTITKVGTAGGTFSIIAGGTCTSTTVLNVGTGNSCTINVQYVPSGTTTATANVTVTGTGLATASQTSSNFTAN
jgi:hypothetical protein